ncbi:MAG: virulence RhuM family protein [Bacilli bacterium]|nr:virulence RhuM family protein [Bacilli bacterium]
MENKINYEIIKFVDGELELEVTVSPNEETIWLNQEQIVKLFNSNKQNVSFHINNILNDGELDLSTVKEILTVRLEGNRKVSRKIKYYNLDMIISIGYRINSKIGIIFRKWANKILKDYLFKGYIINERRVIINNDNLNNLILVVNEIQANQNNFNNRLNVIERLISNKEFTINRLFYNGEFYDAYTLIQAIFESAMSEIIIIDNYVDRSILDRLVVKKNNVKTIIYTNINTSRLIGADINSFNSQYGGLDVKYTTKVHDRYIIIDRTKLYHLGHSIKDLGKKIFSISESDSNIIQDLIINI